MPLRSCNKSLYWENQIMNYSDLFWYENNLFHNNLSYLSSQVQDVYLEISQNPAKAIFSPPPAMRYCGTAKLQSFWYWNRWNGCKDELYNKKCYIDNSLRHYSNVLKKNFNLPQLQLIGLRWTLEIPGRHLLLHMHLHTRVPNLSFLPLL